MSVIGLDAGTSWVKAVRFDDEWRAADAAAERTAVQRDNRGRREQDLDDVWSAAARVVRAVAERSPDPITLLAVTAQGDGCWLVDRQGRPVGPAMLWNDSRAGSVVQAWLADGTLEKAFRISGSLGAPGLANAQLRWLRQAAPERLTRAAWLLSCGSWIFARLTGRFVLEQSEAANPFCAATRGQYDPDLLELFGLTDLQRLLPPIVQGTDRIAPLTASGLGLPAGTPIALAPYDVVATAVGVGAVTPGDAFAILGTTLCVGEVSADPALGRRANGMTLPMPTPGRWLLAYATMNGTETLDWTARILGLDDAAAVLRLAAESAHPSPPLLLPYLSPAGERSPFLDVNVRGSLHGLELGHDRADVAYAAAEGLTVALVDCLRAMPAAPTSLAACGGGARSDFWCQLISDASGLPVTRPDVDEAGARGAVLVAAVDAGLLPSLDALADPGRRFAPRPERTERFLDRYARSVGLRRS